MNANPLVSIVIPCFEHGQFLPEAIASVRSQTYRNIEIIVVDDGSVKDPANNAIAKLEEQPIKIQLYKHAMRRGPSAARNTAIKYSKGELILPLDADDLLAPNHLEKTVNALRNSKFSCVYTDMQLFGDVSCLYKPHISLITILAGDPVPVCTLFRREVYDAVGGYREHIHIGEDTDFATRIIERGFQYAYVEEGLYFYRKHNSSSSTQYTGNGRIETIKNVYREHKELMLEYLPEILLFKENRYCQLQNQFHYETTKEIGVRNAFNLLVKSIINYVIKTRKKIFANLMKNHVSHIQTAGDISKSYNYDVI